MPFKHAVVLTGGIATGKSTVANIFKGYGFEIIDADKITHKILNLEYLKIAELFGKEYIENKKVIRKKLGTLIFEDKKEKLRLELFLHPLIFSEIKRQSTLLDEKGEVYLVDIPLFFETNRYSIKDIIVVYIPENIQLERLVKRNNITIEEAKKRIYSQVSIEEKKEKSTYIIDNRGNLKELQRACDKVKINIVLTNKEK